MEVTPGSASGLGITQSKGVAEYDVATEGSKDPRVFFGLVMRF